MSDPVQNPFHLPDYHYNLFFMEFLAFSLHRMQQTVFYFLYELQHFITGQFAFFKDTLEDAHLSEEDEEALTSCMKLTKPQEKKTWKDNVRRKEETETETRADFISASLGRSYISRLNNFGTISIHSETEFHLWSDWKPFPDNQLCPCDFFISKIEEWENCTCSSHQSHLTCSLTDVDLQYSWVSRSGFFCADIHKKWKLFALIQH